MANQVTSFMVQGQRYGVDADLQFDSVPTEGSMNPVTSNGIKVAVEGATLGTNISVGRTPGTEVGMYSVAYGDNNAAIGTSSIVYGKNNHCSTPMSIVTGEQNKSINGYSNVVMGERNRVSGFGMAVFGTGNDFGGPTIYDGSTRDDLPSTDNAEVYIGYVNQSTKNIYYDPEMSTSPIPQKELSKYGGICLYVDAASNTCFLKTRNNSTYTLSVVTAPNLTNRAFTIDYTWGGVCYWDRDNNKAYKEPSKSTEIRGNFNDASIYYDAVTHQFIRYTKAWVTSGSYIISTKDTWVAVKVYYGIRKLVSIPGSISESAAFSVSAYCRDGGKNRVSYDLHVFSEPSFASLTDITDDIIDGQLVYNLTGVSDPDNKSTEFGGKILMYERDVDGKLISAYVLDSAYPRGKAAGYNYADVSLVAGTGNSGSAHASGIFGSGNKTNPGGYLLLAGSGNTINYLNPSGVTANMLLVGTTNSVLSQSNGQIDGSCLIGKENRVVSGAMQYTTIFGFNNEHHFLNPSASQISYCNFISGRNHKHLESECTTVMGNSNTVFGVSDAYVDGCDNIVGLSFTNPTINIANQNAAGELRGNGIVYNQSSKTYTFTQNGLWQMKVDSLAAQTSDTTVQYMISPDGVAFTPNTIKKQWCGTKVGGNFNTVCGPDQYVRPSSVYGCLVHGSHNTLRMSNTGNANGIIVLGYYLEAQYKIGGDGENAPEVDGAVYLGNSNDRTHHTNLQFSVGIGSNGSTRKDGFRLYRNGMNYAPSAPKTVADILAAAEENGQSEDSIVLTYGMLKELLNASAFKPLPGGN